MSVPILAPLEQLHALNDQLIPILDDLSFPLIVVGGQSVSYWIQYFENEIKQAPRMRTASADIDFVAKPSDAKRACSQWNIEIQMAGLSIPPPSIAIAQLIDKDSKHIKEVDGLKFIDVDQYAIGKIRPNLVDFIDAPSGFNVHDLQDPSKRDLLCCPYQFSTSHGPLEHEKLMILNPIGCLISRIANVFLTPKDKEIELDRIKDLLYPLFFYFQEVSHDHGFRYTKKRLERLKKYILSDHAVQLCTKFSLDLRSVFFDIMAQCPGFPEAFYQNEMPQIITKVNKKYDRRIAAYKEFENRER